MYNFNKRAAGAPAAAAPGGEYPANPNERDDQEPLPPPSSSAEALTMPTHEDNGSAAAEAMQQQQQQEHQHPPASSSADHPAYPDTLEDPTMAPADDGAYGRPHAHGHEHATATAPHATAHGRGTAPHDAEGDDDDAHMFADYRGAVDGDRAERLQRRQQQQQQYDDLPMPPDDADPKEVFAYYRRLVSLVHFVPPRHWREIRFDLPANVAELRLYPQRRERPQDREPIRPGPCIVISLEGTLPENTTPAEYEAQLVQYMFDLLNYQVARTPMTELRFVKKCTELTQLVITLGKDVRLASRVLTELQSAGLRAHYGKPVFEVPPNATFQVVDYRRSLHDGKGISVEDVNFLLEPIRQFNTVDINVIEGYEPGVFYAPVKRPETVYSFLWNYYCSYKFQSDLFRRYGVLVTMAQCPHDFLQKGIPYHIQKKMLEEKIRAELLRKGMSAKGSDDDSDGDGDGRGGGGTAHHRREGGDDSDDDAPGEAGGGVAGEGAPPAWAAKAAEEIDIFSTGTRAVASPSQHPTFAASPSPSSASAYPLVDEPDLYGLGNGGSASSLTGDSGLRNATAAAAARASTIAKAIAFVDEENMDDVDALLKQYHALPEPVKKPDAAGAAAKASASAAAAVPAPPPPASQQAAPNGGTPGWGHAGSAAPPQYGEGLVTAAAGASGGGLDATTGGGPAPAPRGHMYPSVGLRLKSGARAHGGGDANGLDLRASSAAHGYPLLVDETAEESSAQVGRGDSHGYGMHVPPQQQQQQQLYNNNGGWGNDRPHEHPGSYGAAAAPRYLQPPSSSSTASPPAPGAEAHRASMPPPPFSAQPPPGAAATGAAATASGAWSHVVDAEPLLSWSMDEGLPVGSGAGGMSGGGTVGHGAATAASAAHAAAREGDADLNEDSASRRGVLESGFSWGGPSDTYGAMQPPHAADHYRLEHGGPYAAAPPGAPGGGDGSGYYMPPPPPHMQYHHDGQQYQPHPQPWGYAENAPPPMMPPYPDMSCGGPYMGGGGGGGPYGPDAFYHPQPAGSPMMPVDPRTGMPMSMGGGWGGDGAALPPQLQQQLQPAMGSAPYGMPVPPHVQEAVDLMTAVEERVQAAFAYSWSAAADPGAPPFPLDGEWPAEQEAQLLYAGEPRCVLEEVPGDAAASLATLPAPTTEIDELLSFLQRNVSAIGRLLHKTTTSTVEQAAEVAEFRSRVARALLLGATCPPEACATPEAVRAAWQLRRPDGQEVSAEASAADAEAEVLLPALLPYLLRSPAGIDLAMLLAFHFPRAFARRVLPYAAAYLFDDAVVRAILATAVRREASAGNGLVRHVLGHWAPLMVWLQRVAQLRATASAASAGTAAGEDSAAPEVRATAIKSAMKQLVSTLGNTMDTLLALLSPEQRAMCHAMGQERGYVAALAEAMQPPTASENASDAMPRLWGADGPHFRSLLRLYLAGDICDGAALAARMLCPGASPDAGGAAVLLRKDHYFYAITLASRSNTAPVLSREAGAFCGAFLRMLELQHTAYHHQQQQERASGDGDAPARLSVPAPSVDQKAAEQLLGTALRAARTADVYTALRTAYLAVEGPITRFEAVLARLSAVDPPAGLQLHMATLEEWYDGSTTAPSQPPRRRGGEAAAISSIFYYQAPSRRNARGNMQQQQQPAGGSSGGGRRISIAARWRPEWTAVMRGYAPMGTPPFPPLPEGCRVELSRAQGRYSFASAGGAATTRHPVDGKEYLATPQAFLRDASAADAAAAATGAAVGVTLEQICTRANTLHAEEAAASGLPPPAELTLADVEGWAGDQRRRHAFIDLAATELLGIRYDKNSSNGNNGATPASGGVKRAREGATTPAVSPAELQRMLGKVIASSYPASGPPYPPVGRGWSVYLNSAKGQYGFSSPNSRPSQPPSFTHPKTRLHYFVAPQAFVVQRKVNLDVVARNADVARAEVDAWMADQRTRHAAIDAAVVSLIPIHYGDVDKLLEENAAVGIVAAEPASRESKSAKHGTPQQQQQQQQQQASASGAKHEASASSRRRGDSGGRRRRRREDSGSDVSYSDDDDDDSYSSAYEDDRDSRGGGGGGGRRRRGRGGDRRRRRERSPRRRGGNGGGGGGGRRRR